MDIYCVMREGRGELELAPCVVERETADWTDVRRNDGVRFRVGVREERHFDELGWVAVFWPGEAEYL